ncbi:MAG: T9SS type A sorting domain-containing protein [Flavobacteriales bacterium]|nr:T9SS type A sorting domain-containing protein [Flavobacteriales bacterium]MCB9195736.1 T9SS type A sorting domain-containing protein [Flavobacteriales bacterium]
MRNFWLLLALVLSSSLTTFAANEFKLRMQKSNSIEVEFELTDFTLNEFTEQGTTYDAIISENAFGSLKEGYPNLPYFTGSVIIPNQGKLVIDEQNSNFTEYTDIQIAPSKGNLYRNIDPTTIALSQGPIYNVDAFYPENLVANNDPYILRGIRGVAVQVTPFQYNPITKTLRVYSKVVFTVTTDSKHEGINEVVNSKEILTTPFQNGVERHFINHNQSKYTPLEETGSMLIIADDVLMTEMEGFVNWKIKKGIPTEMIGISTIGNNETQIFNYVQDYYNNHPELTFLLLVGDHGQINTYNAGSTSSETKWSDSKYTLLSGNDHYPEIFVGRYSANNSTELATMLQRNNEYEITPMNGDWYLKAIGVGSDEGAGYGDNGEADWQHLRNIRTNLINYGFTDVYEFYDGSHGVADNNGDPNSSEISTKVNEGVTLFNYTGHGAQNVCVTGNFSSNHVNAATNNGKYPYVVSVACNNGTFTSGTCISEAWQRANNANGPTGAIMAAGSSILMAWAPPMATQDAIVDILVESYANNKKYTTGGLFYNAQMEMMDSYGNSGKEVMETWVFFGDPSVMIRTADPVFLSATHVGQVELGETEIVVNCNVEEATIAISQNGNLLGTGIINGGQTTISIANGVASMDSIDVVATAYNYTPYQGEIEVVDQLISNTIEFDQLLIYPNPAASENETITIQLNLEEESDVEFSMVNALGQNVLSKNLVALPAGYHSVTLDLDGISCGSYYLKANTYKHSRIGKFILD